MKPLAGCSDPASLNRAIQELCTELGIVARVDIRTLVKSGKRQALCFLRTELSGQEERLMRTPGATRFGNELLFIVDLPPVDRSLPEIRTASGMVTHPAP